MTQCRNCGADSSLFLCTRCTRELRDMLAHLPRWIGYLEDAVNGQTRLGESARRSSDKGSPALANLGTGGAPRKGHLHHGAVSHAVVDFSESPSGLLEYTHSVLVEWCRDICHTRGHTLRMRVYRSDFVGPLQIDDVRYDHPDQTGPIALWLAQHVSAIACDEGAAVAYREIAQIVADIERCINRPLPPRFVGPCPTPLDAGHHHDCDKAHPHACAIALTAGRSATEVTCPSCGATHNVEELTQRLSDEVSDWWMTQNELLLAMESIRQPVPLRTFQEWRRRRKIPSMLGADGAPRYRLVDAQRLREERTQVAATGASAHRRAAT
ncbi:hypothetical protein E2F47_23605 [Mycobacterium eburneum]|nr:hypothetical protein [Mycobacterium eburneum]TDH48505.1 hypothetical protein E2F47_23605 [Mycobacterium eburneum]